MSHPHTQHTYAASLCHSFIHCSVHGGKTPKSANYKPAATTVIKSRGHPLTPPGKTHYPYFIESPIPVDPLPLSESASIWLRSHRQYGFSSLWPCSAVRLNRPYFICSFRNRTPRAANSKELHSRFTFHLHKRNQPFLFGYTRSYIV